MQGLALFVVGLDPTDVLTAPEAPLVEAVSASIQTLSATTPAHTSVPSVDTIW